MSTPPLYLTLYQTMVVLPNWKSQVLMAASLIEHSKDSYQQLAASVNVLMPWQFVGIIHYMESGCNFKTHLHNGDSLKKRTIQVPAGRPLHEPLAGFPAGYTWKESARDALLLKKYNLWKDWGVADMLSRLEVYNGIGYRSRGINSPYLWSGSNHYSKGKFTSDGHFDPDAVSKQVGAALLLKQLL